MHVAPELARWRADRPVREAARQAARTRASPVAAETALGRFAAALPALAPEGIAEAAMALLADPGWLDALLAPAIAALRADPFFGVPFRAIDNGVQSGLLLLDRPEAAVAVSLVTPARLAARKRAAAGPRVIAFSGYDSCIRVLRAGGARLAFWAATPPDDGFSLATAPPCRYLGRRTLQDGALLRVDGRRESFVVEHAEAPLLLVQASIKAGAAPFALDFDPGTLACVGAGSTDDGAGRVELLAGLLGAIRHPRGGEALAACLGTLPFHARWRVMREWLALDAGRARIGLAAMAAGDPHPELRAAAAVALARMGEPCPA